MNYPLLALDAAPGTGSAALLLPDGSSLAAESEDDRAHSRTLVPMLEALLSRAGLDWSDLRMLALGIGPGSFTGLRIAAATFAGINASLALPTLPVSSLAITAAQAQSDAELWVLEDARAGEVFVGRFQGCRAVTNDRCISWEVLQQEKPASYVSVSTPPLPLPGWQRLERSLARTAALTRVVQQVLRDAGADDDLPGYVQPAYLQISQAEKNLQ
ncbi:MAG: tRNA (adenosine(37)-N6)-threonylcarbamoyltransferase complex dimerization subunit type 1 TsaB [Mariprofundaceae bacterium]|nr:tRNA (adenosine(37)-N6)-threonylcarbamoyltransferase complex dimerization subunit type 1 TsaB [Mariprofundaceae bacterium]